MENTHLEAAGLTSVFQQLWCPVWHVCEACLFSSASALESQRIILKIQYGICSSAIGTGHDLQERLRKWMELLTAAN